MSNSTVMIGKSGDSKASKLMALRIGNTLISAAALYLVIVLTYSAAKQRKDRTSVGQNWLRHCMKVLCILSAYCGLARFVLKTIVLYKFTNNAKVCTIFLEIFSIGISACGVFVYGIQFIKQHTIYSSHVFSFLPFKNILSTVGKVTLLMFIIAHGYLLIMSYWYGGYWVIRDGMCHLIRLPGKPLKNVIYVILGASVTTQFVFLCLFTYPLLYHISVQAKKGRQNEKLKSMVSRVILSAIMCSVTDTISYVIMLELGGAIAVHLYFNVSILVNNYAIVFVFNDWKEQLIPMIDWKKEVQPNRHPNTDTKTRNSVAIV